MSCSHSLLHHSRALKIQICVIHLLNGIEWVLIPFLVVCFRWIRPTLNRELCYISAAPLEGVDHGSSGIGDVRVNYYGAKQKVNKLNSTQFV